MVVILGVLLTAPMVYGKIMSHHVIRAEHLISKLGHVQIIDASWHMPSMNRNGFAEFCEERIPGAAFFDLDECCDKTSPMPHMMPSMSQFEAYMGGIGIVSEKPIVVYDSVGNFSSPRLWWMLKSMGAKNVCVLDGGLRSWKAGAYPLSVDPPAEAPPQVFRAAYDASFFRSLGQVAAGIHSLSKLNYNEKDPSVGLIIDARSTPRFNGEVDEPRPGLRRGHLPFSVNVPWDSVLDPTTNEFLSQHEMLRIFNQAGFDPMLNLKAKVTFSCGSGVTACVPLLALAHFWNISLGHFSVYDGAWSEWGGLTETRTYPSEITAKVKIT